SILRRAAARRTPGCGRNDQPRIGPMLSRVAESIFWIGRYVERAENTARLLDVSLRSTRELAASFRDGGAANDLRLVLVALADEQGYAERHAEVTEHDLATYLILNPENPGSIVSCIAAARDNARAVRESISTEMWEELN